MAERHILKSQEREEKKHIHDHIEYKQKMYEDELLSNKIEKRREQEELRNILNNQNRYKQLNPSNEVVIKPYKNEYENDQIDNNYTLGGFDLK